MTSSADMNEDQLQVLSHKYDAIYFNQSTFESAMLAAGSVIDIIDHVITGKVNFYVFLSCFVIISYNTNK